MRLAILPFPALLILLLPLALASSPPTITNINPPDSYYSDRSLVTFTFTVGDDVDENVNCTLHIDGSPVITLPFHVGPGSFQQSLSEPGHPWYLTCIDSEQNVNQTGQRTVWVDLTAPVFRSHAVPSEAGAGETIAVATTWTEANPLTARLFKNGVFQQQMAMNNETPVFFFTTNATDAFSNIIFTVNATDRVQRSTFSPDIGVMLTDITPPELTDVWPPDPGHVNTLTPTFSVRTTDNYFTEIDCTLIIDGQPVATDHNVSQHHFVQAITLGEHQWHFSCADGSGNTGTIQDRSLTVDLIPPDQAAIIGPAIANAGRAVAYNATWNEVIKNASLLRNGTVVRTVNVTGLLTSITYQSSGSDAQKTWRFTIAARDLAGNQNISTSVDTTFLDGVAPTVTLTSPADNAFSNSNATTFAFTVSDNLDTQVNCSLFLNSVLYAEQRFSVGGAQFPSVPLTEARRTWYISCEDSSGNSPDNLTTRTLTTDLTPPTGTSTTASRQRGIATINGTAQDNFGIAGVTAVLPFGQNLGTDALWRFQNITVVPQGQNSVPVTITDRAGNRAVVQAEFFYDNVPPGLAVDEPTEGQVFDVSTVTARITITDTQAPSRVWYTLNNGQDHNLPAVLGEQQFTLSSLPSGRQTLRVFVQDDIGNIASVAREFVIALPLDMQAWKNHLRATYGVITGVRVINGLGQDVTESTSVPLDDTFSLNITMGLGTATFGSFDGLSATWMALAASEGDEALRQNIREHGTEAQYIYLFPQSEAFLAPVAYTAGMVINLALGGFDVLAIDDTGEDVERLPACGSRPCHRMDSGRLVIDASHFSGIVLANDSVPPNMTVSSPPFLVNQSDGVMLAFAVNEPAGCNYTLEGIQYSLGQGDQFSEALRGSLPGNVLRNGVHTLVLACADLHGQRTALNRPLEVWDNRTPSVTTDPTSMEELSLEELSVQFHVTASETANLTISLNRRTPKRILTEAKDRTVALEASDGLTYGNNTLDLNYTDMNRNRGTKRMWFIINQIAGDQHNETPHYNATTFVEKQWGFLNSGEMAYWEISNPAYAFLSVNIFFKGSMSHPVLRLTKEPNHTPKAPGKPYQYYRFENIGFEDAQVDYATMQFKVPANAVTGQVRLYRFAENWTEVSTVLVDSATRTYRSITTGFGVFAITGINVTAPPPAPQPKNTTQPKKNQTTSGGNNQTDDIEFTERNQKRSRVVLVAIVIGIILLVAVGIMVLARRSPAKRIIREEQAKDRSKFSISKKQATAPVLPPVRSMAGELPDLGGLPSVNVPPTLVAYCRDCVNKGMPKEQVRQLCISSGWPANLVDQALSRV
ncbi:MAG: hypothetical protein V1735_07980 [Nanoarchaeota archaeon]